jgi:hypothetical protein
MKKYAALIVIFFSFSAVYAQSSQSAQSSQYSGGTILIPKIVYVGDPAVLVLPLPAAMINSDDIIMTELSPNLPKDDNIDFHRVILERRVTGSRLLIEFTAFVPGYLKFPEIEIDGEYFGGLSVTINSVIDTRKSLQLSGYASSLAMPGTAVLLYGFLAIVVLVLLLLFWFVFKGRKFVKIIIEKWKRIRLFTFIRNVVRRLQKLLMRGGNKRDILDNISDTFREFLSVLTKANCRSMTAREFTNIPEEIIHNSNFLGYFFSRCDRFRFSGEDVNLREISGLLVDLRNYIEVLYLQERGVKK